MVKAIKWAMLQPWFPWLGATAKIFGVVNATIGFVAVIGYATGRQELYCMPGTDTPMAITTAIATLLGGASLVMVEWQIEAIVERQDCERSA